MGYAALPSIKSGKIRAFAVTSAKRLPLLPDVPTMAEAALPGFESCNWQGIILPAGTPRAIVERLNREVNAILAIPEQRDAIPGNGGEIAGGSPEAFRDFTRSETAKRAQVVQAARVQPE